MTTPLAQPLYGASFVEANLRFYRKYYTFAGRASRSEYWWTYLGHALVFLVIYGAGFVSLRLAGVGPSAEPPIWWNIFPGLIILWGLSIAIGWLALSWRRVHDAGLSGLSALLAYIPGVGILFLIFFALPSSTAGAKYDVRPEDVTAEP